MNSSRKFFSFLFSLLCVSLLASCASHGIRGQPPFVQINSLKLQGQTLALDLGLRNVNSEAIFVEHIEFSMLLDDVNLAIYNAASQASIIANGTENLRFELAASSEGITLLNDLEQGKLANLEYTLDGVLVVSDSTRMKVKQEGHIYPVPGRPGQFR